MVLLVLLSQVFLSGVMVKESTSWSDTEYLTKSFVDIALNNEYSEKQSGLRKWTQQINYFFVHRVADQALHEHLSTLHLEHLAAITQVPFKQVKQKKHANLLIVFSTENRLEQELLSELQIKSAVHRHHLFRHGICFAHFSTKKNGSINQAIVIIPVDRARTHAKLISCIVEELTQVMGLPNDSEKVFPSVFNDKSYNDLLTGLDFVLLKMLYHPALKVGMGVSTVKSVLKTVVVELTDQGVIATAEEKVMEGGLYALLY